MGNAGYLHHAGALAALVLLNGCNQPVSMNDVQNAARLQAHVETSVLDAKVKVLEQQVRDLQRDLATVRDLAIATSDGQQRLRGTVNGNAEIANNNALRQMTARGACGTEQITYPNGGVSYRNRECTLKDLRP